jgi:hypothetical protein
LPQDNDMDLNLELMLEQVALHHARTARSAECRTRHRDDADAIRGRIERRFGMTAGRRSVSA